MLTHLWTLDVFRLLCSRDIKCPNSYLMNILGVKIDNLSQKEVLEKISGFLGDSKFHQIATVGPEFILKAQKNSQFRDILNNCDLNIADGVGIKLAFWRFGRNLKSRFTGVDLMQEILKVAEAMGLSVFLACNKNGLCSFKEIKSAMLKIYPRLAINGANFNLAAQPPSDPRSDEISAYNLKAKSYNLVFCNFGAPHQEIFLNSLKNDTIGVAMGVGGSFDFLTEKIRRAPKFMRALGLEWLWRLFQEPKYRWKRIWNAVIIFTIKVIFCNHEKS
jgi:N-acetylglucosaminyldiphosphoundecaprenol N-acetyl-beta-D-mannosaminyltransferase